MHVIMTGNPVDGFNHFGPFDTHEEAVKFIDQQSDEIEVWVVPVLAPALMSDPEGEG